MLGPRKAFTSRHFRETSEPASGMTRRVYSRHRAKVHGEDGTPNSSEASRPPRLSTRASSLTVAVIGVRDTGENARRVGGRRTGQGIEYARARVLEGHHHVTDATGARSVLLRRDARRIRRAAGVREREHGPTKAGADQPRAM